MLKSLAASWSSGWHTSTVFKRSWLQPSSPPL